MRTHLSATGPERKLILKTLLAVALTGAVWAPLLPAQRPTADWQTAAGGKMVFEVASVTRNTTASSPDDVGSNFPLGPGDVYVSNGGRFGARNLPLIAYLDFAYKVSDNQEQFLLPQLPEWVSTTRFDIQATAQGNPTKDQMRLMMQSLLADRFKLSVHYETRQVPVYALLVDLPGKLGPLLQQHADDAPCPTTFRSPAPNAPPQTIDVRFPATCGGILGMAASAPGRFRVGARNVPMELIANSMPGGASGIDRPVLDRTGLTGRFDFALEFAPPMSDPSVPAAKLGTDSAGPTFVQALKEQLGLRLESQTGPFDVLVLDYVEEPPEN
jgi:bla regulator protein blaR1